MIAASIPAILSACSHPNSKTFQPTNTSDLGLNTQTQESPTISATKPVDSTITPRVNITTSPDKPYMVVVKNGSPELLVEKAIEALGGMQRFVPSGSNVVIKPNICTSYHPYEFAATTNPWVVGALIRLCFAAGAKNVSVMDFPFGGSAEQAYSISGIGEQVVAAGGQMVLMSGNRFIPTEIPQAIFLKTAEIYEDILQADVVIDVPIAKHHGSTRLSLSMKNLMGVVKDRSAMHANLNQSIADLANHIRPALTVIDAVRILTRNGPTGGDLADVKQIDTLIASHDMVAADAYASTLFDLKPDALNYVKAGAELGLGSHDLSNLNIAEINLAA